MCKIYVQVLSLVLYLFLIRRRLSFLKTFLVSCFVVNNIYIMLYYVMKPHHHKLTRGQGFDAKGHCSVVP